MSNPPSQAAAHLLIAKASLSIAKDTHGRHAIDWALEGWREPLEAWCVVTAKLREGVGFAL
jgi:hypothetical protein